MSLEKNQNHNELVAEYHKNPNQFVFFIGSGLSSPLFPTWYILLEKIINEYKESFTEYEYNELSAYLKNNGDYLDIAEHCIKKIGEIKYRSKLEEIFDCDIDKSKILDSYKELFILCPQIIITTNYDRIPETLCEDKYRLYTNKNASECSRAISDGKKIIFKLHGDILDQSSIILKRTDYQKVIFSGESNTRQLLQGLLTSKKFIFLGFSLSDPHITLILENLKIINNNIPISHFILLNEQSKLQISMYEDRYGIKIIPYSPEDKTHFEITDFLRCLNTSNQNEDINIEENKPKITDKENLLEIIFNELSQAYKTNISIICSDKDLSISFSPIANTMIELQKELLSIYKLFITNCQVIDYIYIKIYSSSVNSLEYSKNQETIFISKVKYEIVNKFANKQITSKVLWDNIEFIHPPCISNILQPAQRVIIPFNSQIIDI